MKILTYTALACLAAGTMTLAPAGAEAKGCIKGAIVGGVAGHMVGHGKMGAVAGCVVGHSRANKASAQQNAADPQARPR